MATGGGVGSYGDPVYTIEIIAVCNREPDKHLVDVFGHREVSYTPVSVGDGDFYSLFLRVEDRSREFLLPEVGKWSVISLAGGAVKIDGRVWIDDLIAASIGCRQLMAELEPQHRFSDRCPERICGPTCHEI